MEAMNMRYSIEKSELFNLKSCHALAKLLKCTVKDLEIVAKNDDFYKIGNCQTGDKTSVTETPVKRNRKIHDCLFRLLKRIKMPDYVHLGPKGRSYITNASVHVGTCQKYHVDISNYFQSTTWHKVYLFFLTKLNCARDLAGLLASIVTYDKHIPTGSPISTVLAFWANKDLFDELYAAANNIDVTMTLFQDDITFSGSKIPYQFRDQGLKTIQRHGLLANQKKTAFVHDFQPLKVTGIIVKKDGIDVPALRNYNLKARMKDFQSAGCEVDKIEAQRRVFGSMTEITSVTGRKFHYRNKFMIL